MYKRQALHRPARFVDGARQMLGQPGRQTGHLGGRRFARGAVHQQVRQLHLQSLHQQCDLVLRLRAAHQQLRLQLGWILQQGLALLHQQGPQGLGHAAVAGAGGVGE